MDVIHIALQFRIVYGVQLLMAAQGGVDDVAAQFQPVLARHQRKLLIRCHAWNTLRGLVCAVPVLLPAVKPYLHESLAAFCDDKEGIKAI